MPATGAKQVRVTELRQNVYAMIDQVIESGVPLEINRHGVIVTIHPPVEVSKLDRLKKFQGEVIWEGDREDLFKIDHLEEWRSEWGVQE